MRKDPRGGWFVSQSCAQTAALSGPVSVDTAKVTDYISLRELAHYLADYERLSVSESTVRGLYVPLLLKTYRQNILGSNS